MAKEADPVLKLMKDNDCDELDIRFTDVPGTWQHVTLPIGEVDDALFIKGTGFDGSSIRGFQAINESDMLLIPDPATVVVDPFMHRTASIVASVRDPMTGNAYPRDPRYVAQKAEQYLRDSGIGDVSFWGPELEFFIFDSVRFGQTANTGFYEVDSEEGIWRSGESLTLDEGGPNLGMKPRYKGGYFPVPPVDTFTDIRSECAREMARYGIIVEKHHHEVATAGQGEIDMRFDELLKMADNVMAYKYVVKNVAGRYGKVATFMPKPLFGDNGTGMHVHQSIWKGGDPLFAGDGYAGFSELGLHYVGGLLAHAPALMAFLAPTSNSYKRLVPGFEAPTILALSARNRSAAARIPMYFSEPKTKRVEFRPPDPTANPYLAFSAMLMAGLDGIRNKTDPGAPVDEDLYTLPAAELAKLRQVPGSLAESLNALEADHDFLTEGDVFTKDLIEGHIAFKRETEVDEIRLRPHPYEFHLTFDA
ncbi:MAG: type I glutamate--ammonia ligase [Chloroflexi bacterium]|nr:type I glutamate--ammonia ligase [Chloroflexota bacterium]MCH7654999.1 type I glutamate--ammonia ligase [Chloroflexota bacterium]